MPSKLNKQFKNKNKSNGRWGSGRGEPGRYFECTHCHLCATTQAPMGTVLCTRGYCAMYPWVLAQPWSSPLRGERSGALPAGSPPFSGRTSEAPSPQLSPRLVASQDVADPCSGRLIDQYLRWWIMAITRGGEARFCTSRGAGPCRRGCRAGQSPCPAGPPVRGRCPSVCLVDLARRSLPSSSSMSSEQAPAGGH